jgi:hypothetical protein
MYPIFKIFQKHTPAAIPPASTGLTAKPYGGQPLAAISHDDDDLFVENKKLQSGPFWPPEAWRLDPWPPRGVAASVTWDSPPTPLADI